MATVQPVFAQDQSIARYQLFTQIPVVSKFFTTDPLQQVYAVTPNNTVIKFVPSPTTQSYQEQYRFSNNTLGELGYVDVTDPFNLLLYYPDYQIIVTLDRTLNQTGSFNLIDVGVVQARAVGMSNDGNIWVYDEVSFQLRQLSRTGEVLFESQNLSLILPKTPQPVQLIARENRVYLNDPQMGILVFNNFGQYLQLLPIQAITNFQILDNRLVYAQNGQLHGYDLYSLKTYIFPLPEGVAGEEQVQMQHERLFVVEKNAIKIFTIH